jgi:hypothetical protein
MSDHPTTLELELARKGEAAGEIYAHAASCAACRAELDFLERLARDQGAVVGAFEAPPELEDEMAAIALGHAERVRAALAAKDAAKGRRRFARTAPWAAAAAVVLVAAAGALWRGGLGAPAPAARTPVGIGRADDVNRDGRVDVLDAFALARAVDAGDRRSGWDLNRDGVVDKGDVDAVAMAAVSLGGGGR